MTFFYISFAGEEGFRGATVVAERNIERALRKTWRLGINPSGEAAILTLPEECENDPETMEEITRMLNRLVPKDELIAHGATRHADLPQELKERFEEAAAIVCSCCNPPKSLRCH
jgi:hypothetical protein